MLRKYTILFGFVGLMVLTVYSSTKYEKCSISTRRSAEVIKNYDEVVKFLYDCKQINVSLNKSKTCNKEAFIELVEKTNSSFKKYWFYTNKCI